jgi:hypothetical protein
MNLQEQRTALRTQLLDLSRLSQRALDYSVKGYELKNSDFSRQPGSVSRETKERYTQIRILCRQLIGMSVAAPCDFRFSLAALRLNSAFYKTYKAATRIAQASTLVLGSSTVSRRAALDEFGKLVNRLVRLSTVALFLNDSGPAEEVLHNQAIWRRSELLLDRSHSDVECDCDTLAIMQNLSVVAKQAHEMADAILFWLKGRDCALAFETEGHHALEYLIPKSVLAVEKSPRPAGNQMLCC